MSIPVIDFNKCSLEKATDQISDEDERLLAAELYKAFSTIGFVYLKNHGIPEIQIKSVQNDIDNFFTLPVEVKTKYSRHDINSNHGWNYLGKETLNPERPFDFKESYNVTPYTAKVWPDKDVPGFQHDVMSLFNSSKTLCDRILKLMAIGLNLESDIFVNEHMSPVSMSTLRCLYYPPITDISALEAGQVRCGEHSDYGSITLLFQDDDGLQVKPCDGPYVDATPIPGTVVVNIGDLMQRWTADRLVSTKHRVIIPEHDVQRRAVRKSIAYFSHPYDDCMIKCIDGSNKYEPITSLDYLKLRFSATY